MADFISRDAEIQFFNDWVDDLDKQINDSVNCPHLRSDYKVCKTQLLDCIHAIKELPVADAVEVVRCKECKYWCSTLTYIDLLEARHDPYTDGVCDLYDCDGFQPNDFCSKAVRRDNYGADMREPNLDATKGDNHEQTSDQR